MEPILKIVVVDPESGLKSYVVVDSLVEGYAMGGTRMIGGVTLDEVAALARRMTLKLALVDIPIGGAKAGIVCDLPSGPARDQRLAAFGRLVRPLLHGGVYLGSDQGISHRDRDVFFEAAEFDVCRTEAARRLPCTWTELWHACEDVTGFGVCEGAVAGTEHLGLTSRCRSVAIQGFGAVGRAVASGLAQRGFNVVAVADRLGTVYCSQGLPLEALMAATDALGTVDRAKLPAGLSLSCERDAWLDAPADVLVLAAGGGAVHAGNVGRIGASLVVEGANLPCTAEALHALNEARIAVLPDIVVNCGGAAVTGLILTGAAPEKASTAELVKWLYDEIAGRIRRNVVELFERATADGRLSWLVAQELASERRREAAARRAASAARVR